jgi:hypothetical protein
VAVSKPKAKAVTVVTLKPKPKAQPLSVSQMTAWSESFNKSSSKAAARPVRPPVVPTVPTTPTAPAAVRVIRRSALTLSVPGGSRPSVVKKSARDLKSRNKVASPARSAAASTQKDTTRPARRSPEARVKDKSYRGYDATSGERSRKAEREKDLRCKPRPEDNSPRKGGGGGPKRDFIPWCK